MNNRLNDFGFPKGNPRVKSPIAETQPILLAVRLIDIEDCESQDLELFHMEVAAHYEELLRYGHLQSDMFD